LLLVELFYTDILHPPVEVQPPFLGMWVYLFGTGKFLALEASPLIQLAQEYRLRNIDNPKFIIGCSKSLAIFLFEFTT